MDRIEATYRAFLDELVCECHSYLGPRLRALYLRGSVPRGVAVSPIADIDLIAVTTSYRTEDEYEWGEEIFRRYAGGNCPVSGVDVEWCVDDSLVEDEDYAEVVLQLATQSVCLYGNDQAPALPRFRPNEQVANFDVVQIEADLVEGLGVISNAPNSEVTKYWCIRISKNLLRTGFSFVMVDEGQFTRDLAPSYLRFRERYPEQACEMYRALHYAINPSSDSLEVLALGHG